MISAIMEQINYTKSSKDSDINEELVRHIILNIIRTYVKKFKSYGTVVLACDNKNYWRKQIFPNYKYGRKKAREKSDLDWNLIFKCINTVRDELIEFSPYKVINVESVEADDIIAVLAIKTSRNEKVMILSSDKDFAQLQKYENIEQYSPILKKFIKESNPQKNLKELIIRGDPGDGIPNILSSDDTFVENIRQKPIRENKLNEWLNLRPEEFCANDEMLKNYKRNEALINLEMIPSEIKVKIIETYDNQKPATKSQFLNYMISKRLRNLIDVIHEF